MALLATNERETVWRQLMQLLSDTHSETSLTKAQLRAAVDAIDQWCEDNVVSFNTAIPQPARSALTPKQKAQLLMYVASRRNEVT